MQPCFSHEYLIYIYIYIYIYIIIYLTYYATLEFKGAGISLEANIMSTAKNRNSAKKTHFKLSTVYV